MTQIFLRALFPSWKFFDQFEWFPVLYYRVAFNENDFSDWNTCLKKPQRTLVSIFFNPNGNLYHASNSAVERLALEASQPNAASIENSVSYRIISNLVRSKIRLESGFRQSFSFQFKIRAQSKDTIDDIFISQIHEAQ